MAFVIHIIFFLPLNCFFGIHLKDLVYWAKGDIFLCVTYFYILYCDSFPNGITRILESVIASQI